MDQKDLFKMNGIQTIFWVQKFLLRIIYTKNINMNAIP